MFKAITGWKGKNSIVQQSDVKSLNLVDNGKPEFLEEIRSLEQQKTGVFVP